MLDLAGIHEFAERRRAAVAFLLDRRAAMLTELGCRRPDGTFGAADAPARNRRAAGISGGLGTTAAKR
jgi:hypothetical protein